MYRWATLVVVSMVATLAGASGVASGAQWRLGDRALRPGATGSDVRQLQQALAATGFFVATDGDFSADTELAVERFQAVRRLYPSGTVGQKTLASLRAAATPAQLRNVGGLSRETADVRTDRLGARLPVAGGMSGHDVRILQSYLRRAVASKLRIDGQFDRSTELALRAFERLVGRATDGALDAGDLFALRTAIGHDVVGMASREAAANRLAPGDRAVLGADGLAIAPAGAPPAVARIIAAGNAIATTPYRYGGGHARWADSAYDCSGSVSYALHGAGLIDAPMASGDYMRWGDAGPGTWVTIYANPSHMYVVVAGLRFDTSGRSGSQSRWQATSRAPDNYTVRHPPGL